MTRIDELLSAVFYRRACPPAESLGDYHLGRLAPGERLAVALHLRECPHCPAELALYSDDARRGPVEQAINVLGNLVSRVIWPTPALASAPVVRGSADPVQTYEFDGGQLTLERQPALSGYRRRRLVGKVEPAGGRVGVELWSQGDLYDSLLADETGYFTFDRLKPGSYLLVARRNGLELWIEVAL